MTDSTSQLLTRPAGGSSQIGVGISGAALLVAIIALVLSLGGRGAVSTPQGSVVASSLAQTLESGVIRVGYSGFQPYTIEDPNAAADDIGRVTGLAADIIHEIAGRQSPPLEVEWHKVTFETLRSDMYSGRFDVFADAVYQTVPRASQFGFSEPYGYFGVGVGVVRVDETRFESFSDVNRSDVVVSLAEGWTATEYARRVLDAPELLTIAVGDDPFVQFQDVLAGRADIALQDVPTVLQFVREHPNEVKALWLDSPPSRVPAGFLTRAGDWEMLHFLNVALRSLEADGTLEILDGRWQSLNDWPVQAFRTGSGFSAR